MDTCCATHREASRLYICELAMNHDGEHREGEATWTSVSALTGTNHVIDVR